MSEERKPKYQIGDKVKLNVGGPDMAIDRILISKEYDSGHEYFSGKYSCQWFAGKKLDSGNFPEESLVEISEQTDPTPRPNQDA
ncbi:YodC family protein [Acinetobacter johnsonii]|uniref:YodC family protein n=1 Tax=Acinetobacter johnsonii TaxID=40214 RepID=UPI001028F44C|nr:DUF2158 domain-containing protein [Acinetobacter johnsonii]RZN87722.1 DUF2158 domain-containing protein [Acinetobacter johnsonii]